MRFVHATDAANAEDILRNGIVPKQWPRSADELDECRALGIWNPPCVFADVLAEDRRARYNGWASVLWRDDQNLCDSERVAQVVFELAANDTIYVGQWGHPLMFPGRESKTLLTTWSEYAAGDHHAEAVKTTVGEFERVISAALQALACHFPGPVELYDLVMCQLWPDDRPDSRETHCLGRVSRGIHKAGFARIELERELKTGDRICIHGPNTDFDMTVDSMKGEYQTIASAVRGTSVRVGVPRSVQENDAVHKIVLDWKNPLASDCKEVRGVHYPWTGPGFEISLPYHVQAEKVLGFRVMRSKEDLDVAWYEEGMFRRA